MPVKMLLESSSGKGNPLTLQTCSVIMYDMGRKRRGEHNLAKGVLGHCVADRQGFDQPQMPLLAHLEGGAGALFVCLAPQFPLQGTHLLEHVDSEALSGCLPAAGLPNPSETSYEIVGISKII